MCGNPMGDDDDALSEICALKDALCAQQELLQKLYSDLDAEREASASAASEALAVILRLQGEKAAVQMEADHYKRLSEEKICHAEESLAMIEDTVYQKEMEVAALDYQLQAYRSKLLSVGCDEHGFGGEMNRIGRRHSVPISCRGERDLVCGDVEGKVVEEMCLDSGKKIDGYWEKIRRLDERVKEIAGGSSSSRSETRSPSSSLSSRLSRGSLCDPTRDTGSSCQPNRMMDGIGETKSSDGVAADGSCSTSIHDVFEVPQADERCESMEKDEIKNLEKEDVFPEAAKMARDEPEWFKNVLQSSQVSDVECGLVVAPAATSIAQFHMTMSQVGGRSEIVENDRPLTCRSREEELKLLHELKEKVNLLHDEIRSLKGKKPSPVRKEEKEETSLAMALLAEAMLSFWL
ncbi:uncharacterized protein LOC121805575 [Salvia splendens]|uniref:uncharacterized protein LOC121805575 n=1 Tax=Salvia splendens TaxID=180675 RepID=UPI001C251C0D|nr:uncharacterized protein LOC121805575 [Salvia splendens]XP_042061420.1 uncharacterized protein LOC121805575 [Salvia splendens]XP_042061421.1 uncharacterized protein LOC121805575 [Salvia splendens]